MQITLYRLRKEIFSLRSTLPPEWFHPYLDDGRGTKQLAHRPQQMISNVHSVLYKETEFNTLEPKKFKNP